MVLLPELLRLTLASNKVPLSSPPNTAIMAAVKGEEQTISSEGEINEKSVSQQHEEYIEESSPKTMNEVAFKADDSDGKVEWTIKRILTFCTLGGLYVGKLSGRIAP